MYASFFAFKANRNKESLQKSIMIQFKFQLKTRYLNDMPHLNGRIHKDVRLNENELVQAPQITWSEPLSVFVTKFVRAGPIILKQWALNGL